MSFNEMPERNVVSWSAMTNNVVVENSAVAISPVASSIVVATISLAKPFLIFYRRRHCLFFF